MQAHLAVAGAARHVRGGQLGHAGQHAHHLHHIIQLHLPLVVHLRESSKREGWRVTRSAWPALSGDAAGPNNTPSSLPALT